MNINQVQLAMCNIYPNTPKVEMHALLKSYMQRGTRLISEHVNWADTFSKIVDCAIS